MLKKKNKENEMRRVRKLSFGRHAVEIKRNKNGPKNDHRHSKTFLFFETAQNKIAVDVDHLFILVTRGVILYRCWFSGPFTPIEYEKKIEKNNRYTQKRSKKNKNRTQSSGCVHLTRSIWWHNSSANRTSRNIFIVLNKRKM